MLQNNSEIQVHDIIKSSISEFLVQSVRMYHSILSHQLSHTKTIDYHINSLPRGEWMGGGGANSVFNE